MTSYQSNGGLRVRREVVLLSPGEYASRALRLFSILLVSLVLFVLGSLYLSYRVQAYAGETALRLAESRDRQRHEGRLALPPPRRGG